MAWSALAYNQGKLVKPIWDSNGFNFQTTESELSFSETPDPTLIWDMRGIIKNRPDPFPLPFSPKETYLDCGLKWGEDIIDLIMADRGTVVLPLRNLRGFDELDEALSYAEDTIIGIDWSQEVESVNDDFSIDIVRLLRQLHQRGQMDILVYSLTGEYPYIPAGATTNFNIKLATLSEVRPIPSWAQGVFSFE
ncbi:uncharacterized protein METZ01_LOCUS163607 [marine metagenome]|jgi:hypothetical protein|uniref:Uncharacterized protein n=1 Tax=marine metagenome TaxID=408172 RepID=A0A382BBX4_9ZZZZ|nr:hypothetical protein [Candidatus Poseidoniia archaeon]|tara:strand:- start:804 stop:1382 length:579 start_codon:yes stop_codon:yes gene_type:complete